MSTIREKREAWFFQVMRIMKRIRVKATVVWEWGDEPEPRDLDLDESSDVYIGEDEDEEDNSQSEDERDPDDFCVWVDGIDEETFVTLKYHKSGQVIVTYEGIVLGLYESSAMREYVEYRALQCASSHVYLEHPSASLFFEYEDIEKAFKKWQQKKRSRLPQQLKKKAPILAHLMETRNCEKAILPMCFQYLAPDLPCPKLQTSKQ